jgi:hypothetical protein
VFDRPLAMHLSRLTSRLVRAALVVAALGATAPAQQPAPRKTSPFMPPPAAGDAAAAPSETIEFAGVSSVGKRLDLIFHDKGTKKNHWIGIGETKEGIAVISYDERREQVSIKLNGVDKILPLRKGTPAGKGVMGAAPPPPSMIPPPAAATPATPTLVMAPAPAPALPEPAPTGPPRPETQLKQETEARMLVSDLLEIGMAQRKAYEEAQRRAAEGNTQPPPASSPTPAQPEKPNGG